MSAEAGQEMTEEVAGAVFDVLVQHAGASLGVRDTFVAVQSRGFVREYRIGGPLGFGGKFRRSDGATGPAWSVDAYLEDMDLPGARERIAATNAALAALRASLGL